MATDPHPGKFRSAGKGATTARVAYDVEPKLAAVAELDRLERWPMAFWARCRHDYRGP